MSSNHCDMKCDHCCPVKLMSESLQANTDGAYSEINCVPDLNAQLLFWQSSGFCSTGGFDGFCRIKFSKDEFTQGLRLHTDAGRNSPASA